MRKFPSQLLAVFAMIFIAAGCTKEGPVGPAGVQGPQGATGATGTANVTYSAWFAASTLTWADSTHATYGTISRANRTATGITANVVDQGVVISYHRSTPTGTQQLPFIYPSGTNIQQVNSFLRTGAITYFVADLTDSNAAGIIPAGDFRYVIVPGSIAGGRITSGAAAGYSVEELKAMSYEQVLKLFRIPADGSNL